MADERTAIVIGGVPRRWYRHTSWEYVDFQSGVRTYRSVVLEVFVSKPKGLKPELLYCPVCDESGYPADAYPHLVYPYLQSSCNVDGVDVTYLEVLYDLVVEGDYLYETRKTVGDGEVVTGHYFESSSDSGSYSPSWLSSMKASVVEMALSGKSLEAIKSAVMSSPVFTEGASCGSVVQFCDGNGGIVSAVGLLDRDTVVSWVYGHIIDKVGDYVEGILSGISGDFALMPGETCGEGSEGKMIKMFVTDMGICGKTGGWEFGSNYVALFYEGAYLDTIDLTTVNEVIDNVIGKEDTPMVTFRIDRETLTPQLY